MIGIIILSFVILFGFMGLGVYRFGMLPSYSSYAMAWHGYRPLPSNLHLWSIVTIVAALLMFPPMITIGEGNVAQSLGFFAPLYLMVVGLTPDYETIRRQKILHIAGTAVCALCAIAWLVFVVHKAAVLFPVAFIMFCLALLTRTYKKSLIFWGEATLFFSCYFSLFLLYV